jgi:hypothetical protein
VNIEKTKELIKANIKWENVYPPSQPGPGGGQSCGMPRSRQRGYSEELDLTIELGYHRSALKNREAIYTLFELILDDLIK